MSGHKLTIRNPTGEGVFTQVELDGETQYVSSVSFHNRVDARGHSATIEATLVYPQMAVEVELEKIAPIGTGSISTAHAFGLESSAEGGSEGGSAAGSEGGSEPPPPSLARVGPGGAR